MFQNEKVRTSLKWLFRLLALAMLGGALFFFYQTATVFLKALDMDRRFGTPDNLGYGIAFYLLVFTLGFSFLAVWFHRISQVFQSARNMAPPGLDHPGEHDGVEDVPQPMGAKRDG